MEITVHEKTWVLSTFETRVVKPEFGAEGRKDPGIVMASATKNSHLKWLNVRYSLLYFSPVPNTADPDNFTHFMF